MCLAIAFEEFTSAVNGHLFAVILIFGFYAVHQSKAHIDAESACCENLAVSHFLKKHIVL